MMPSVDSGYYEDMRGRVLGLLITLGDRLSGRDEGIVHEYLDHNELGLALEHMADALGDAQVAVTDDERSDMVRLAATMQMDGRVPDALGQCPRRL